MAVITPALITSLRTGFSRAFQDSLAATPTDWAKVATRVPSTSASPAGEPLSTVAWPYGS